MTKIVVDKYREYLPATIITDRVHAVVSGIKPLINIEVYDRMHAYQDSEDIIISTELYEAILKDPDIRTKFLSSPKQLKLL